MTKTPNLNASSRIMYEEAQKRGIACTVFGDHETILMQKGRIHFYTRGSRTSLESSVGSTIANDKGLTKRILTYFHLPTAHSVEVDTSEDLEKLHVLHFPLVMKPRKNSAHGKGVIVGIPNLSEASQHFSATNTPVLFEEMLAGVEYRILCVNFQFVAAAFRKPAHVIGDGQHTIEELIAEKNRHPWRGEGHVNNLSFIKIDELVVRYLQEQGLTIHDTPEKNREVLLRKTANLSTGGEAWDVSDEVCEENKKLFSQIAFHCDLNVTGIDVMCQSLSRPITKQEHAGVIEVNSSPGLRMHHFPLKGQPKNVAGIIFDMVFANLEKLL